MNKIIGDCGLAYQSIWYQTELNPKIIETIEEDLTNNFQNQMGDSKLMGDALNRDKRNSKNEQSNNYLRLFRKQYFIFCQLSVFASKIRPPKPFRK